MSESTLKKHYVILNNMLKRALRLKLIKNNPINVITPPKPEKYEAPVMTEKECDKLLEVAREEDYLMYIYIYTLLMSGMRRGEALGLEWNEVNFKDDYIYVKQSLLPLSEGGAIHEPKVKGISSKRKIYMYDKLRNVLKKYQTEQNKWRLKFGKNYENKKILFFHDPMVSNIIQTLITRI